jgi:predicted PurR-regulated permease PerM
VARLIPVETAAQRLLAGRALMAGVWAAALPAVVALLYFGRDFFVTLAVAALFAFVLDPAVVLVSKLHLPRGAATAVVTMAACIAVYLAATVALGQLASFAENLPGYTQRLSTIWQTANDTLDRLESRTVDMLVPRSLLTEEQHIQERPEALRLRRRVPAPQPSAASIPEVRIHSDPKPAITVLYGYVSGYLHVLVMASFVPFLVYFMLSWRDHLTAALLHLFDPEDREAAAKTWSGIGASTRAYIAGNFFLWIVLACASAAAFFVLGVPYWPAIGPLSAFFSLVPYVGLPLAIAPPILAAMAAPITLKFLLGIVLLTAALHVSTMNLLYAKVIGRRVRLNPLAATIALMFWGSLWGGIGLILAIPLTAALKAVCENVRPLEAYGRLLGD